MNDIERSKGGSVGVGVEQRHSSGNSVEIVHQLEVTDFPPLLALRNGAEIMGILLAYEAISVFPTLSKPHIRGSGRPSFADKHVFGTSGHLTSKPAELKAKLV